MKISEFKIGERLYLYSKEYLCTDIGTRTVVCLHTNVEHVIKDPSWLKGPPYALKEEVFDEHDIVMCTKEPRS